MADRNYHQGRPFTYNPKDYDKIVASVIEAKGSLGQVADLNKIPRQTFRDWVRLGDEQNKEGLETEFVHLSCNIRHEQAKVVIDLAKEALENPKKAVFIMWWLGKICREDFGPDSDELRELRKLFEQILPHIGKGVKGNGREQMDSEGGKTSGCIA